MFRVVTCSQFSTFKAVRNFRKFVSIFFQDLSSQNMYDAGVALNGLSCFITPDLARDLANDIMTLVRE